eukprot:gnl/Trimastix_PCT/2932.p2 GENE.gnl/Trimastix_PCT/2932~~gnl/Trimastix_PCT/2932.p2  ORF type:complete len:210 (+),score=52.00 gnl/Trimastix_PCT/2932:902-1531(+)
MLGIGATAVSVVGALYLVAGLCGYLSFTQATRGDVLSCYSAGDPWAALARATITVTLLFSYPLVSLACRQSLDGLLFSACPRCPRSHWRLVGCAAGIVATSCAIAILCPDVGDVFMISGASFGVLTSYILPSLFALRARALARIELELVASPSAPASLRLERRRVGSWVDRVEHALTWVLLVAGAAFGVLGTVFAVRHLRVGDGDGDGH